MYPMNEPTTPDELRVSALQNAPAFNALYTHAPASLVFKGRVIERDAATTVEERLYYLSALAMTNPDALYELSQTQLGPYSLDADDSEVVAAQAAVRLCEKKVSALITKRAAQVKLIQQSRDVIENMKNGENIALGIFTAGIATAAMLAEATMALNQRQGILVNIDNELEAAKDECASARREVTAAQSRLDVANRKLREEEEKDRQRAAKEALAEAERRKDEAETRAAEAAAKRAADAAEKRAKQAAEESEWYANNPEPEPDYSSWNPSDYPAFGEEEGYQDDTYEDPDDAYWADTMTSGIFGSEQQTAEHLEAIGETRPRRTSSPYYFDRYYACDACANGNLPPLGYDSEDPAGIGFDSDTDGLGCDDGTCPTCAGEGLEGYGAEGEGLLAIFAGVLALAPSVINAFSAPAGGSNGNVTKETTEKILKETGVQDKIDAAAAREGEKVKTTVILVGVGLGILALKFLA